MKISSRLIVPTVGAALILFFAWEWYLSPKARVARFLDDVATTAESTDTDKLLTFFSRDYSGFQNMDYDSLSEQMKKGLSRIDRLNVTLRAVRPEVEGDRATATFDLKVVAIRGQQRFLVVGGPIQPEKLQIELKREKGSWKIVALERHQRDPASPPPGS